MALGQWPAIGLSARELGEAGHVKGKILLMA